MVARTEAILARLPRTRVFQELVPLEAGVGWPIVHARNGDVFLDVLLFGRSQPARAGEPTELYPPLAMLTLDWRRVRPVGYRDLRSLPSWNGLPTSGRVGAFPHDAVRGPVKRYLEQRSRLLGMYDVLCDGLAAGEQAPPEWCVEFGRLLRTLIEPGLEPYYRALAPDFFERYLPEAAPGPTPAAPDPEPTASVAHEPEPAAPDTELAESASSNGAPPELSGSLSRWIREARELADTLDLEPVVAHLDALAQRRREPAFRIALVGEGRHRPALVNALLGTELVPAGAWPPGGLLLSIRSGASPRIEVEGAAEPRPLEPAGWDGLGATGDGMAPAAVRVTTDHPWLEEHDTELVLTPDADTASDAGYALTLQAVRSSDAVVMTVNAVAPLSMSERGFIEQEVLARHLPRIVVCVVGLEQVEPDERDTVVERVRAVVAETSPAIDVLVAPPAGHIADELQRTFEGLAATGDRRQRRSAQITAQLADHVRHVADVAATGVEAQRLDAEQLERERERARRAASRSAREWELVRVQLEQRRLDLTSRLEDWLGTVRARMDDELSYELSKASDPKRWWEEDFERRARKKIGQLSQSFDRSVMRGVETDMAWLDGELKRRFGVGADRARATGAGGSAPDIELVPDPIELKDSRRLRTLGRVAGVAMIAAVGVAGAGPLGLAAGTATTLTGEKIVGGVVTEQRDVIRHHLGRQLAHAIAAYQRELVARLERLYAEVLDRLRAEEDAWQRARLAAVEREPAAGAPPWGELLARATELHGEIAVAAAGTKNEEVPA